MCEFKSYILRVRAYECACVSVQNIKASRKVHSSINLYVNHAHSSHIATPPSFLEKTFVLRGVRVEAGLISCNLGYSYNTSCSHVRNSRAFSPHCASSPPSLICLLHFIIHLNGEMKYLFRLRESTSFVRNRLLKSCIKSDANQFFVTHRNSGILA